MAIAAWIASGSFQRWLRRSRAAVSAVSTVTGNVTKTVEQIQSECGRVLVEAGEGLGAGDDGQGGFAAVVAEEGSCRLDTVEVVDQDHRVEQEPHRWSSHSCRIRV